MRLKSNAVWHSLPGVEAVYQPIGAPSPVDALLNVGHDHRMVGRYTATAGVLPAWSAATGLTFNGTGQYLRTKLIPLSTWTVIARISRATGSYLFIIGTQNWGLFQYDTLTYYNGSNVSVAPYLATGVAGMAGPQGFRNGIASGAATTGSGNASGYDIFLGNRNDYGAPWNNGFVGNLLSVLIASRPFTPAEMWLASRQMAYCEVNPDWNAWGRRRNYYYAPSAAAIRWPGVGRGGPVGGSPGIRGSQ